jgi:hypothetical protein
MSNKVIPFPKPKALPEPLTSSHSRLILTIANRSFAFDFFSRVIELNSTSVPRRIPDHSDSSQEPKTD